MCCIAGFDRWKLRTVCRTVVPCNLDNIIRGTETIEENEKEDEMIEILLLLGVIGACSADSKKEEKKGSETTPASKYLSCGGACNPETYPFLTPRLAPRKTKRFYYTHSGYDSKRQVWWTREDSWEIGDF